MIHPGKNFTEGHTYVVALRNLRTAPGKLIKAPQLVRAPARRRQAAEGRALAARPVRAHLQGAQAGRDRARQSLYEAWDFTIGSRQSLTGRMLAIRNNAFAQLGDTNLGRLRRAGPGPSFQVTGSRTL